MKKLMTILAMFAMVGFVSCQKPADNSKKNDEQKEEQKPDDQKPLDERRMELCFEGHRFFDVFRNRRPLDRRYVGYHTWEIIQPGDLRIALLISQDEINASNIEQNPR